MGEMSKFEQYEQIGKTYERLRTCQKLAACCRSKVSELKRELQELLARFDHLAENAREPLPYPTHEELGKAFKDLKKAEADLQEAESEWEQFA